MKKNKTLIKVKIEELCGKDYVLNDFLQELVDFESGGGGQYRKRYEKTIENYLSKWSDNDEN